MKGESSSEPQKFSGADTYYQVDGKMVKAGSPEHLAAMREQGSVQVDPSLVEEGRKAEAAEKGFKETKEKLEIGVRSADSQIQSLRETLAQYSTPESYADAVEKTAMKGGAVNMIDRRNPAALQQKWTETVGRLNEALANQVAWRDAAETARQAYEWASGVRAAAPETNPAELAIAELNRQEQAQKQEMYARYQGLSQLWETANSLQQPAVWDTYNTKMREYHEDQARLQRLALGQQILQSQFDAVRKRLGF